MTSVITSIKDLIASIFEVIFSTIKAAFDAVFSIFHALFATVASVFVTLLNTAKDAVGAVGGVGKFVASKNSNNDFVTIYQLTI
jgi:phage-related protein